MRIDRFVLTILLFACTSISSQNLLYKWKNYPTAPAPLQYSSTFQNVTHVERDINGNYLLCGYYHSHIDFDPQDENFDPNFSEKSNAFVAKLDPSGQRLWVKTVSYVDGLQDIASYNNVNNHRFYAITSDSLGNIYAGGRVHHSATLNDPNWPYTLEGDSLSDNTLLVKYDPDGNVIWAETKGTSGFLQHDEISALSIGPDGFLYVGGRHGEGGGTLGIEDPEPQDLWEPRGGLFIKKMTLDGDSIWLTRGLTTIESNRINSIEFTSSGDPVLAFSFFWCSSSYCMYYFQNQPIQFYPNPLGLAYIPYANSRDFYGYQGDIGVVKLDKNNGNLLWITEIGGIGKEEALDMKLDSQDNIYVCGFYSDSCDFAPGIDVLWQNTNGGEDIFLAKYDSEGQYLWHKTMGSSAGGAIDNYSLVWYEDRLSSENYEYNDHEELAKSLGVDENDNVYIAGNYKNEIDFGGDVGIITASEPDKQQPFVAKYSPEGDIIWVHQIIDWDYQTLEDGHAIMGGMLLEEENTFVTWVNGDISGDIDPSLHEEAVYTPNTYNKNLLIVKLSDQPCLGDLSGDNSIDSADLLTMLGAFNSLCQFNETCATDLNNDGITNAIDLLIFLGQIGNAPCP